ncbi:hypothetical protein TorRG33x02_109410 [Trema orientale]|uniref:Uncharacterized protein n=1 Tax=Trema orientale TaxID=63057 RepID=A0A2P5F6G0_TREOI|nr:hypothetical protein TorRG33x02_109410 [Trema orientale]
MAFSCVEPSVEDDRRFKSGGIAPASIKQDLLKMFDFASMRISHAALFFCLPLPKTSLRTRNLERNFMASAATRLPGTIVPVMSRLFLPDFASAMPLSAQNCCMSLRRAELGTNSVLVSFSPVLGQIKFPALSHF